MSLPLATRETSELLPVLLFALNELAALRKQVSRLPLSPIQRTSFCRSLDSMERQAWSLMLRHATSVREITH
jgi:hypothetical protein